MHTSRTVIVGQDTIIEQEAFALVLVEGKIVAVVVVEHPTESAAGGCVAING